jgi:hypothetical protein
MLCSIFVGPRKQTSKFEASNKFSPNLIGTKLALFNWLELSKAFITDAP